ncbi:hypothetical protein LOK49_LG07G02074 [Camellia lanceoleosa]|uniref:Uncharacterized protein n=1 Tax=Camellia lanceoleosa TaxID=1840588 RepID=A0ACC0GZ17_9ERIC|nr:hypothetical protein LOK49_LG07G02074 [Camellia lanceoleosa]
MVGSDDFLGQESHDDVMMEEPNVELTLGLEYIEMEVEEQGVEEPKVVAKMEVKVEEGDKGSKVVAEVGLKEEENGEEPKLEAEFEVEEEEDGEELKVEAVFEVKDGEDGGEVNMAESDDFLDESDGDVVAEAPYVVLTLAQEIVETKEVNNGNMVDIEKSKEVLGHWLLAGKNTTGDHFLQPCNMEDDKGMDSDNKERKPEEEEEKEEDEDEEEEDDGFNLTPGGHNIEGVETCQIPFSLPKQLHGQSDMELLAYGTETHTNSSGPSILGNDSKREIDHEHDISHDSPNGSNKRLRTDDSWGHKSSDFEMCMEQKTLQRKDGEIYRLELELYVMGSVLEGYRKALKETHKAFIEYRQQCQLPEEQFYKDAGPGGAGPGGVILSTMELEKHRPKQEEEDRLNLILLIEQKAKELEEEFFGKLEAHFDEVQELDKLLIDFENKVKLLKELSAKHKEHQNCIK